MATPSSPASASASASDGCSPRSSPTRSNTAPPRAPSYLPGQAGNTSPTRNTRFQPHIPFTSYKQSQTGSMPSLSNFEVNGFSGTGSQNPQSTFQSQASVLAQQDNENETAGSGMNPEKRPAASWGRPLILQEDRQGENTDPMEDLPSKSWEELETRYERDMEAAIQHEQSIVDEIEWVMKMMKESTITSSRTESERAKKRLRTRIAYVQQSEEALAERRTHYKGVVDAFQNAMALLGGI